MRVPFGLDAHGNAVWADQIPYDRNGFKCGLVCPDPNCGKRLKAVRWSKDDPERGIHYLAHEANSRCAVESNPESLLHLEAKAVLQGLIGHDFYLPNLSLIDSVPHTSRYRNAGKLEFKKYGKLTVLPVPGSSVLKFGPETYKSFIPGTGCMTKIEDVKTERDCGAMCPEGLIPDAVALLSHADTEIWVAIEFRVSHPKAIEDVRKYATVDFPVMEISITDDIANAGNIRKSLAERITGTGHATRFAGREWLYSPAAKKILNLEYANKLLFDCQAGDRDGMDPRRCAREDLINGVIAEFGSEYIMTGDAGQKNRLNSAEILRFELDSVPTDGNGHITGYFHGFPLGTSLEDISAAIDNVGKVENGHPNRIDVPEEPERIEPEQNVGVSNEKPTVTEIEDSSIREPKSHPTQSGKPVWTNLEVPPDNVRLLTGVSRKTDRPWYRADCTLGEESSIKPGGKFKILLSERQYARADAQKKAGKPVSLGLKTARYPDGVEIDGEMVALEDLAADINVRKTNPLPKSPEEYRGATEQSFDGNEWVNFRFFPDLVDLSKSIDPDTARTDYRADVTSEVAGRNCSFTLHLAKWQYDKAVKDQNQNSPIHIGMKLKYIKGGVIPVVCSRGDDKSMAGMPFTSCSSLVAEFSILGTNTLVVWYYAIREKGG